jgi:hypothetical protein
LFGIEQGFPLRPITGDFFVKNNTVRRGGLSNEIMHRASRTHNPRCLG